MKVWPALRLEYAMALVIAGEEAFLHHIDATLDGHARERVPPFSVDLLSELEWRFRPDRENGYPSDLAMGIHKKALDALTRADKVALHVQRMLHQLIRPSGNSSLALFIDSAIAAYCRLYGSYSSKEPVKINDAAREAWALRNVLPFRNANGRWETIANDNELIEGVRLPWFRWDALLEGISVLAPFREILLDGLRRTLGWSFLVLLYEGRIAVPVFVEAGIAPGTSRSPTVFWRGLAPTISLETSFEKQAIVATGVAVDVWLSRNRIGCGDASGRVPLDAIYGSTLVLDASLTSATLRSLRLSIQLEDRSAGLPIAVGVIGLLTGHPVDPTMLATGTLFDEDEFLDRFDRRHYDGSVVRYDGHVSWLKPESADLASGLARKLLLVARAHGIARELVLPVDGAAASLKHFKTIADEINRCDGMPTVAIARVPLASVAADAALPVTFRKVRAVLAPDVLWAFSLGHRTDSTPGAYQPFDPARLESGRGFFARIRDHSVYVVSGPALSGKTYAICQAITAARRQLHEAKRPQPHIAVIRWPRYRGLVEEAWRMTLQALSFPTSDIEAFLEATSPGHQARIFVDAFRAYGPDILVLCGIDGRLEEEQTFPDRSSKKDQRMLFAAISKLLVQEPRHREPAEAHVLGRIELILESKALAGGSFPTEDLMCFAWSAEDAWKATTARLEKTKVGQDALRLLGPLSLPEAAYSSRVLRIAQSALSLEFEGNLEDDPVMRCLRTARLMFDGTRFVLLSPKDRRPKEGVETGPLLREAHGRLHVHPLIREHAASSFNTEENGLLTGRIFRRIATEETCPFLSAAHGTGLAPTMALYPERLLQAHDQLIRAEIALEHASGQAGVGSEREAVQVARLELLAHYHDPHHGVARSLHVMEGKYVAGPITNDSLRRRRAFLLMREYLRRVGDRAHPERWLVLCIMANRLKDEDLVGIEDLGSRERTRLHARLEAFIGAERAAAKLDTLDADLYRSKVEAWFAGWVTAYGIHPDFPFGLKLPSRFTREHAEKTLFNALRSASDEAQQAIPLETFYYAGDAAAAHGRADETLYWYHLGARVMRASGGKRFYADLALRAQAFALLLPSADQDIVADLAWLGQEYERATRGHRGNPKVNPLIRYAMFILDRHFGITEGVEIVAPPVPAEWCACVPQETFFRPGKPFRLRRLLASEVRFRAEHISQVKQVDGTWISLRDWREVPEDPEDRWFAVNFALGSDGREYYFYRVRDDSAWGMTPGRGGYVAFGAVRDAGGETVD